MFSKTLRTGGAFRPIDLAGFLILFIACALLGYPGSPLYIGTSTIQKTRTSETKLATPVVSDVPVAGNGSQAGTGVGAGAVLRDNVHSNGTCPARAFAMLCEGGDVSAEHNGHEGTGADTKGPILVIVVGASGSGKSMLGAALAASLMLPFTDADALYPQYLTENVSADGLQTDAGGLAWLETVRNSAAETYAKQAETLYATAGRGGDSGGPKAHGAVAGFSALNERYWDVLRGFYSRGGRGKNFGNANAVHPGLPTFLVYVKDARPELLQGAVGQTGHCTKASQFWGLMSPGEHDEENVVVVPLDASTEEQVRIARKGLKALGAIMSE